MYVRPIQVIGFIFLNAVVMFFFFFFLIIISRRDGLLSYMENLYMSTYYDNKNRSPLR